MNPQPQPQTPATDTPEAQEDNGTQDVNTSTKAGASYEKKISSATLEAERDDTKAL